MYMTSKIKVKVLHIGVDLCFIFIENSYVFMSSGSQHILGVRGHKFSYFLGTNIFFSSKNNIIQLNNTPSEFFL
jgi:hypothetical protein